MATIAQSKTYETVGDAAVDSFELTFDSATEAGSVIAVCYQIYESDDSGSTRTVSAIDNKDAVAYSTAVSRTPAAGENAAKWRTGILYFENSLGGAGHRVTITSTEQEYWVASIYEIRGLRTADALYGTVVQSGGTSGPPTGTALTPPAAGMHFALISGLHETPRTYTPGAGWTEVTDQMLPAGYQSNEVIQRAAVASVAQTASVTPSATLDEWIVLHVVFLDAEGEPTPATLSIPTPSGTLETQTTATIGCTTDQNSGTLYVVVDSAANMAGITDAQIIAGTNANDVTPVFDGSGAISTTSPSVGATDLTAGTPYSYAAVQTNANGNSNVVTGTFTTAAATITPTKLSVISQPGNTVVGQTIAAVQIAAQDADNQTATGFTGDVTIALQAGSGALAGTLTRAATAGVATFNDLSISTLNTDAVLRATSDGLTQVDTDQFDITAGTSSGGGGSLIGSALVS